MPVIKAVTANTDAVRINHKLFAIMHIHSTAIYLHMHKVGHLNGKLT